MKCGAHTEAETSLRCGKCGCLICPRCMVQSPVGARCARCAGIRKTPTYDVSWLFYVRGAGVGLVAALPTAFVWSIVDRMIPFFYLDLLLAGGFGYGIGELISLATNRKRGRGLAIVGGVSIALAYALKVLIFGPLPFGMMGIVLDIVAVALGVLTATNRLR